MFRLGTWRTLEPQEWSHSTSWVGRYGPLGTEYDFDMAIRPGLCAVNEPGFGVNAGVRWQHWPLDWPLRPDVLDDTYLGELVATCNVLVSVLTHKGSRSPSCSWYELKPETEIGWVCLPAGYGQVMEALLFETPSPTVLLQRCARRLTNCLRAAEPGFAKKASADSILDLFQVADRTAVTDFLVTHQDLVAVLADAYTIFRQASFFPEARLSLQVLVDPENEEDDPLELMRLIIVIITDLSPEEAFERRRHLQDSWWLDVFAKHGDFLGLDVEFI